LKLKSASFALQQLKSLVRVSQVLNKAADCFVVTLNLSQNFFFFPEMSTERATTAVFKRIRALDSSALQFRFHAQNAEVQPEVFTGEKTFPRESACEAQPPQHLHFDTAKVSDHDVVLPQGKRSWNECFLTKMCGQKHRDR